MIGTAVVKAAERTGMPDGVFSLLHGSGEVVGQGLVKHPKIKAAGFTGSQKAGRLLYDLANQRLEPIPFFAEMGSVNPVLLLPSGLNQKTAVMLAGSITMGVGQFCTNPGIIISLEGTGLTGFINQLGDELSNVAPDVMLTKQICKSYNQEVESLLTHKEITLEARADNSKNDNRGRATLVSVSGKAFINNPKLSEEVFGPYSLIIRCQNKSEIDQVLNCLDGQLTGSIIGDNSELSSYDSAVKIIEKKVGRLIFNNVPTGVEVCPSMQHGGPYPASSDSRFSSVGTAAIKRFVRPITYQSWPNDKLPDELKDNNPLNIWRVVDGQLTKDQ
jgi:NADP-dependent aldehyde dehydrogenase